MAAMTSQVMDATGRVRQHPGVHPHGQPHPGQAGTRLRRLRSGRRVSQLALSLQVGVSQRHLSCIETGRARASRDMLLALLDALEAPLVERNEVLLAAGFAPAYGQRALSEPDMAPAREALRHLLAAHEPAPAMVLDGAWNVVEANRGAGALLALLRVDLARDGGGNVLRALRCPGPLRDALVNRDEVCTEAWRRAQREAAHVPGLRALVEELHAYAPPPWVQGPDAPLLLTRLRGPEGELRFFSTFTTFGAPLDVTLASLRVEHLFPADEATRRALAPDRRPA
jgi:transcriptional regulator with XRE-family HTH domain